MPRTRWRPLASDIARTYTTGWSGEEYDVATKPVVTSFEFMTDDLHDIKQVGKTLNDIGGPLDLMKVSMDIAGWDPTYSCSFGDGLGPGKSDIWIPNLPHAFSGTPEGYKLSQAFNLLIWSSDGNFENKTKEQALASLQYFVPDFAIFDNMDSLGATAVSRCLPTNPAVDVATAVAELISERKFFSAPGTNDTLSGEWLNWSLGISPSISFAQDLRETMEKSDELLKQYERDAGRLVRREYRYDPIQTTKSEAFSSNSWYGLISRGGNTGYSDVRGNWGTTMNYSSKLWFNGAFTYALPEKGWRRTLAELDQSYGLVPGIDTAWELLPFSFVADYFVNIGDVLTNVNAFATDGLVMPYGYIMNHQKWEFDVAGLMEYYPTGHYSLKSRPVSLKVKIERKRRQQANPFGFGLTPGSLTLRQWSILGALGINLVR